MLKVHFQGMINPYFKSDVLMTQGQFVKLDPANAGKVIPTQAGDIPYGILAQDVVEPNVDNFKLTSVTHKAHKGIDNVGVYHNGGVFTTDQFVGTVAFGAQLYTGANGALTATASGNAVAIAENAANKANGDTLKFKLLV